MLETVTCTVTYRSFMHNAAPELVNGVIASEQAVSGNPDIPLEVISNVSRRELT